MARAQLDFSGRFCVRITPAMDDAHTAAPCDVVGSASGPGSGSACIPWTHVKEAEADESSACEADQSEAESPMTQVRSPNRTTSITFSGEQGSGEQAVLDGSESKGSFDKNIPSPPPGQVLPTSEPNDGRKQPESAAYVGSGILAYVRSRSPPPPHLHWAMSLEKFLLVYGPGNYVSDNADVDADDTLVAAALLHRRDPPHGPTARYHIAYSEDDWQ